MTVVSMKVCFERDFGTKVTGKKRHSGTNAVMCVFFDRQALCVYACVSVCMCESACVCVRGCLCVCLRMCNGLV